MKALVSLMLGIVSVVLPLKAIAAERIVFDVLPFGRFYLQIDDLETFIKIYSFRI